MKPSIRNILHPLSGVIPAEKFLATKQHRFIFPFWHAVSNIPTPHLSNLFSVPSKDKFERDLDFLLKHYRPATTTHVLEFISNRNTLARHQFFPTFDDGLSECYHVIAPILKKKGIEAAFFINSEFVDNKSLFHRHKSSLLLSQLQATNQPFPFAEIQKIIEEQHPGYSLQKFLRSATFSDHELLDRISPLLGVDFDQFLTEKKPYMSLEQIKSLQSDGFLIGSHGTNHREYFQTGEKEILHQIKESIDFLKEELHPEHLFFAFPFTDFNVPDQIFEEAARLKLWDISFGTAGIKDEKIINHIQRIPMEAKKDISGGKIVRTEYIWYFLKSFMGKNKVRR